MAILILFAIGAPKKLVICELTMYNSFLYYSFEYDCNGCFIAVAAFTHMFYFVVVVPRSWKNFW